MSYIAEYIKYRISKNKNFIGVFIGGTGTGKSYAALYMAKLLDPDFDVNRQVIFSLKEFQDVLLGKNKLEAGKVVIFDEAGLGFSSRSWFSEANRILGAILQSYRFRRLITFFTTPELSFVDVQARKLFHMIFEMRNINYRTKTSLASVKVPQIDRLYGKYYFKAPVIYTDGAPLKISTIIFHLPPKKIIRAYEKKREPFIEESWKQDELKKQRKGFKDMLDEKDYQVYILNKAGIPKMKIAEIVGCASSTVYLKLKKIQKIRKELGLSP